MDFRGKVVLVTGMRRPSRSTTPGRELVYLFGSDRTGLPDEFEADIPQPLARRGVVGLIVDARF